MFQKIERGIAATSQILSKKIKQFHSFAAKSFSQFLKNMETRRKLTFSSFNLLFNSISQKVYNLIQIQSQEISAQLNDWGPYKPNAESTHPKMANLLHRLVVYLASLPFVFVGLLINYTKSGFTFIFKEFSYNLGLYDKKEHAAGSPSKLASVLNPIFRFLATIALFIPSLVILIQENILGLLIGILNGLNITNFEWKNKNLKRNTRLSQSLGFALGDAISAFLKGLSQGFSRIRNIAYKQANEIFPKNSFLSAIPYYFGLFLSATLGLISLFVFDAIFIASFQILAHTVKEGVNCIYPNDKPKIPLKLLAWQHINPSWIIAAPVFLLSLTTSFYLRFAYSLVRGFVLGLIQGLRNQVPDENFKKEINIVDSLFNGFSQVIEKFLNWIITAVLYATIVNTIRHFSQGLIDAFKKIYPSQKVELNLINHLNSLEENNYPIRLLGQGVGTIAGFMFFIYLRTVYSSFKGLGLGFVNGLRLSVFLAPIKNNQSSNSVNQSFNRITNFFDHILSNGIQFSSQVFIEGILIKPTKYFIRGIQNGYNVVFPSNKINALLIKDIELQATHFFTRYFLGPLLEAFSYYLSYSMVSISRFSYQIGRGLVNGIINGGKIGLDMAPKLENIQAPAHPTDIFFNNVFRGMTAVTNYIGITFGAALYNLLSIINGFTYPSRFVYSDENERNQALVIQNLEKKRGYPGFALGFIPGFSFAIGVTIYRTLGNTMISFYHSFTYPIASALAGTSLEANITSIDNRSELAKKFGFIGNVGVLPGFIVATFITIVRHLPPFIARHFKLGFIQGLEAWFDENAIKTHIDLPILAIPLHIVGRLLANIIGLSYNNFSNMGWLIGLGFAAAYTDKGQENPMDFSKKSFYQKAPGRTLPIILSPLVFPFTVIIISLWRMIEQNTYNIYASFQSGYDMSIRFNPAQTTFEKIISIPSWIIGLVTGFTARMMVDGFKFLTKLPRIVANNFQFGLRQGLKPFVDPENLITDKPYNYSAFPVIAFSFVLGAIVGILNNLRLAIRFDIKQAIALAYADKDIKNNDSFATKSQLRQVIGQFFGLPINICIMPLVILTTNIGRFISLSLENTPHGVTDGYHMAVTNKKDLSRWEALLATPAYVMSFILGFTIKLTTDFISKNCKNMFVSVQFWHQLLWADKKNAVATQTSKVGLLGSVIGHLFGLTYFILRGASRFILETMRGLIQGVTANNEARALLSNVEKRLSFIGFYLGLGLNKCAHLLKDTIIEAYSTSKILAMLPYGLATQFPKLNLATSIGITIGLLPFLAMALWRFGVENIKSLASISSYFNKNEYPLEEGRKYYEQYGFGCIGCGIGYAGFLIKNACLITVYVGWGVLLACGKAISIRLFPRFNLEVNTKLNTKKDTFHELYAELNNIQRAFPQESPSQPVSYHGGKGFYAFIGKVMDLNYPSLSEKLLDKALTIFVQNNDIDKDSFIMNLQIDEEENEVPEELAKTKEHIISQLFKAS